MVSSSPTASPATVSSWPMWVSAPNALDSSAPEFTVITGMPAFSALRTTSFIASGLASETISPSTIWSM